jgi:hypothetical protein
VKNPRFGWRSEWSGLANGHAIEDYELVTYRDGRPAMRGSIGWLASRTIEENEKVNRVGRSGVPSHSSPGMLPRRYAVASLAAKLQFWRREYPGSMPAVLRLRGHTMSAESDLASARWALRLA